MKTLATAPQQANTLTVANGKSLLATPSKAQKLRTRAQEPHAFKEHLTAGDKRGTRPETAEDAADVRGGRVAKKSGRTQEPDRPGSVNADGQTASRVTGRADGTTKQASTEQKDGANSPAGDQSADPEVQQVIAQVLAGVDPTLRLRLSSVAKAAGTVAGNASDAMRNGGDPTQQGPEAVPVNTPDAGGNVPISGLDPGTPDDNVQAADAQRAPVQAGVMGRDGSTEKPSEPSVAGHETESRATRAVDAAVSSVSGPQVPTRMSESKLSLTPTLVPVEQAGARSSQSAVKASEPRGSQTLAQQVQRGLEVAMQDLPSPSGERLVTLKLNPSALGSLRISMQVSGDSVNVRFQVGSAKAKAAIGKSIEDLKDAIDRQGLRVASIEVEEDRALAAPTGGSFDHHGQPAPLAVSETPLHTPAQAGKGFAELLSAPPGSVEQGAADGTGRTPIDPQAETEGGVLQVLTFRLDAVG